MNIGHQKESEQRDTDLLQQDNERYEVRHYQNGPDDQDVEIVAIKRIYPIDIVGTQMDVITNSLKKSDEIPF